jgi:hypothetical protein
MRPAAGNKEELGMNPSTESSAPGTRLIRVLMWSVSACLLVLPAVAMMFTDEVSWNHVDFIVFALMLSMVCGCLEIVLRRSLSQNYLAGFAVALLASFLLIWVNLAVGIVGNEGNPVNLWFYAAPCVGVAWSFAARFRAGGMAQAMIAAAIVQAVVAIVVLTISKAHTPIITATFCRERQ